MRAGTFCRRIGLATASATVALICAGRAVADRWEQTRRTVIDPLNSELHRHLPTYLRQRRLVDILALYVTDVGSGLTWEGEKRVYPAFSEEMLRWGGRRGEESIRTRYEHLLALFPKID